MTDKRKKVVLSIQEKLEMIKQFEIGASHKQMSLKYGIGESTVRGIVKQRDKLMRFASTSDNSSSMKKRKTMKTSSYGELDAALLEWVCREKSAGTLISGPVAAAKAKELFETLGMEGTFDPTAGWLTRFKQRHGLKEIGNFGTKTLDTPASTQSSSENETQVSIKIEETPSEDFYQDDEGDASEAEDVKMDDLDIADTRIILHEVEPLNVQYAPPKECDLFGEYVATHLQKLPVHVALKLQSGIQALVTQTRLEYIREHPSEAPLMVQEETPEEADSPEKPSNTNIPASDNPQQSRSVKRVQETDQHGSKRFKLDSCDRSDALPTQDRQNQNKRTECMVFAEHIALQLEQLPEETSLRLQSDIYAMIMQAYLQSVDDDAPNRVKIKSEPDLRTLNQC